MDTECSAEALTDRVNRIAARARYLPPATERVFSESSVRQQLLDLTPPDDQDPELSQRVA